MQWRTDKWQGNSMIRLGSDKNAILSYNFDNDHFQVDLCPPPYSWHFPRKTVDMVESGLQRYSRWPPFKLQSIWASLFFADFFTGFSWEALSFFAQNKPLSPRSLQGKYQREDPQKKVSIWGRFFLGSGYFFTAHSLRFLNRKTCWKVYFISRFKPSFPQARTGSQCIVPLFHGLWSTGGHFETSSSYCGVKNIASKAFRLFNLSMWRHW